MSKTASLTPSTPVSLPETSDEIESDAPVRATRRIQLRKPILGAAGFILLIAAGVWAAHRLEFAFAHEETDDAQVEGDISPVLPRVSGYVQKVLVHDNEHVTAGQPLLQIDSRELNLKVANSAAALESAQAALITTQATVAKTRAALAVAQSAVEVAQVRNAKAISDLHRDTALFQTGAITDRQLSDTQAAADIARTELVSAQRQVDAARSDVAVAQAQTSTAAALVDSRRSDLEYAQLQRSYATVTAPISGDVSRKTVEPGQYVQAGQTLLSVTSDSGVWIVANFKETQLAHLHAGQAVELTMDSYPGQTFAGRVDSIAGATGARFALLPPDNASGNFIKVTQRVPVKILVDSPSPDLPLRPGMSVDAAVAIKG